MVFISNNQHSNIYLVELNGNILNITKRNCKLNGNQCYSTITLEEALITESHFTKRYQIQILHNP